MSSPTFKVVNADRIIRRARSPSSRSPKMTDPNKPKTPWSFGGAGVTPNPSNPFSQVTSDASKPAVGLFGSGANPPASSGTGLFGSSSTAGGSSLFGATSGPSQTPAFGSGSGTSSIFGGGSKPTSTLFGQAAPQSNQTPSSTAPASSFMGLSTPNKPADPAKTESGQTSSIFGGAAGGTNTGGIFGNLGSDATSSGPQSTTTPTSKPSTNFFANSTTPAGPPPSTGTGTSGASLFSKPSLDGPSIFGKKSDASTSQPSSQSGSGAFGGLNFGSSKPQESASTPSTTQPASIFGSTQSTSASDIFGKKPAQAEGGLFQNLNKSQETGASKPATSQQSQNEAPKAPNLFSLNSQPTNPSTAPASTAPAFSFAKQAAPVTSPSAASSGFNLFNKDASSSASTPSTSAPVFPSSSKPQDKAPASTNAETPNTTAPSSSAPALSSSLFNNTGKPTAPTVTSQAPAQTPAQAAATDSTQAAGPGVQNLGASTAGPVPPAQSRLKNKSMDEIITRWASDLSKYQKEFQEQAERVADWDRKLVENSEKIQKLYGSTLEAERATAEVERQLTAVENDQAELSHWLDYYEKEVDSMISSTFGQDGNLSGPDQERERTYQLTYRLSDRLDEMGKDLSSMIEEINDASSTLSKNVKTDDPLSQVVRILNGHLTQLQQIDQGTAALQLKVREAQRAGQSLGPPRGLSGPSSDAADGFYRSYMGRR